METILDDLWYGRINPNETIYRDNPEYQKAQKELNKKKEAKPEIKQNQPAVKPVPAPKHPLQEIKTDKKGPSIK